MSVLIKGVEKPKWCSACVCNAMHYCQALKRDVSEYLMTNQFPDDCPLNESIDFTNRETNLLLALLLTERSRLKDAYGSGSVLASLALTQTLNELDAVVGKLSPPSQEDE